jgi:hypothetical protein
VVVKASLHLIVKDFQLLGEIRGTVDLVRLNETMDPIVDLDLISCDVAEGPLSESSQHDVVVHLARLFVDIQLVSEDVDRLELLGEVMVRQSNGFPLAAHLQLLEKASGHFFTPAAQEALEGFILLLKSA